MKYKLTNPVKFKGRILYRVQALKDFNDVKKGDLGGYIESEKKIFHKMASVGSMMMQSLQIMPS